MKKVCLAAFSLLIFLAASNISFATSNVAYAKDLMLSSSSQKINYELPYPGLLPDSPLYFLRIVRDKSVSFLISDPKKKAEFDLLQADKRLNTGIYLFKEGKDKYALAVSTISKGENYFEEAIAKAKEAKKQKMETNDLLRRLSDSAYKHQEVLKSLEKKSGKDFKEGFVSLRKRVDNLEKQADSLRS